MNHIKLKEGEKIMSLIKFVISALYGAILALVVILGDVMYRNYLYKKRLKKLGEG